MLSFLPVLISHSFVVLSQADAPETARADAFATEMHDAPECACLKEIHDLRLCGLAEEPTLSYDFPDHDKINRVLVKGMISNICEPESVESRG